MDVFAQVGIADLGIKELPGRTDFRGEYQVAVGAGTRVRLLNLFGSRVVLYGEGSGFRFRSEEKASQRTKAGTIPPREYNWLEGEAVLVQGPGPLGLFAVAFARKYGAYPIVLVGGTEARLEMGRRLGATHILNRRRTTEEERSEAVLGLTGGRGADVAYEAVGRPEAVAEGLRLVRRGGSYLSMGFGVPAGSVTLDMYHDLEVKDLSLHGVWVSHTEHTRMALELVLERLKDVPDEQRAARFRCVLALAYPDGTVRTFEGTCEGQIVHCPRGQEGFGYDPLFLVPSLGKTFGEISRKEKSAISHRGRALRRLKTHIRAAREAHAHHVR